MMSQSQGLAQCPICLSSMCPEGDHKICTLKCGHIFGYLCIFQWLENNSRCPICRRNATTEDIIPLIWDSQVQSNDLINQLNEEKDKLLQQQQNLAEELKSTKDELNSTKDELHHLLQLNLENSSFSSSYKSKSNSNNFNSFASIIYERKLVDSFRLLVSNNQLFLSQKSGSRFGIEISPICNFNNRYFLSIHDGQIRDISNSPDYSTVATASLDKTICVINNKTAQAVNRFNVTDPLWCCCWISRNLIAAGGNSGKLFIRDTRSCCSSPVDGDGMRFCYSNDSVYQMATGPPIFSIIPLSTTRLLCVSPIIGRFFDLRNAKFEPNSKSIDGGHLACSLKNFDSSQSSQFQRDFFSQNYLNTIMVTSRIQPNSGKSVFYSQKSDGNLHMTESKSAKYFSSMARQFFFRCNGTTYAICPDESINDFDVVNTKNDEDLWARWRQNFAQSAHPSPVLDVAATRSSTSSLMIFSLSSSLLRVNMLRI